MSRVNIIQRLDEQALARPQHVALSYAGRHYELDWVARAVESLAACFAQQGVRPGTTTGLLIHSQRDLLLSQLAVARLGATVVNLSPLQSSRYHHELMARTRTELLLSDGNVPDGSYDTDSLIMFPPNLDLMIRRKADSATNPRLPAAEPQAPWMLLVGSGSTGRPKILPLSHDAALARGEMYGRALGRQDGDRLACLTPLEQGFGAIRTAMMLCSGGSVALQNLSDHPDPESLRQQGVTILLGGVSHARRLLEMNAEQSGPRLSFLRAFILGGSTVSEELRQRIITELTSNLHVNYGTQESGPVAMLRPSDPRRSSSVGRVIQGAELRVVDRHDQPLPAGEIGFIQIRSPGMIDHYLDDPEASAKAFRAGWFCPADIGFIGPEGQLIYRGREDHMMIFDGINIYPAEVEDAISAFPGVVDVACVPMPSDSYQDIPLCVVSLRSGYAASQSDLHQFALDRLGPRRPREFIVLASIPRTPSGKLIRRDLYAQISAYGQGSMRSFEARAQDPSGQGASYPGGHAYTIGSSKTAVQVQAFPASYAQSRLWFLHQLDPELATYHMSRVWRLHGPLDLKALEGALAGLIERHTTLRTSFRLHDGEVVQLIHPPGEFSLAVEELGERDGDEVIAQWLDEERQTPFDLTSGRLIRARLLVVDHQHHMLLVNQHHIASDGWSHSVLARDLTELYNARRLGRASELAPLRVRYHDYAAWQRQRLSGDRLQSLKDYWISQLTGLEPLELPSDHPRPATPSHRGASVAFQISPELLAPFEELCRLEGATLQMGLLALFALLLHRYSRQDDVAIGVPIWGRNHPDFEPLIGFFINTLPIRARFEPRQSLRQLLQQVRQTSIEAYDHQELPFEQIVEALNPPRDISRNPLVQVMLQLIELPDPSLQGLDGLEVKAEDSGCAAAKVDLFLQLRRSTEGGLSGSIGYATDLFDAERIERMASHLTTLLGSLLQGPDVLAGSLSLLPAQEREQIERWQKGSWHSGVGRGVHPLLAPSRPSRRSVSVNEPGHLRVCLIGDSVLAVRCAEILKDRGHNLILILPTGRTLAQWAIDHGVPILNVHGADLAAALTHASYDVLLSVFNDHVLPAAVLETARQWAINFHDSLLPRYAGLNAPSWALINEETIHGITWHRMTAAIDRGDVLRQVEFPVPATCDALQLQLLCIEAGVTSFEALLSDLERNRLRPRPIDPLTPRTFYGRKARPPRAGLLDLSEPLARTLALVRGLGVDSEQSSLPPPILATPEALIWIGQAAWVPDVPASTSTTLRLHGDGLQLLGQGGALALRSLRSLWGESLTLADLQGLIGDQQDLVSPALSHEQRQLIESLDQDAAQAETFWIAQLGRLGRSPIAALPVEGCGQGHWQASLPIPPQLLHNPSRLVLDGLILALFAQALAEVVGQPCGLVGLLLEDPRLQRLQKPWSRLFSACVPLVLEPAAATSTAPQTALRQQAQALAEQLECLESHTPYRLDLIGRKRDLRKLRTEIAALPQAIVVCRGVGASPAQDDCAAVLTLVLPADDGQLRLIADRSRLSEERWHALIARLDHLLGVSAALRAAPSPSPAVADTDNQALASGLSLVARIQSIAAGDPLRWALVDGSRRIGYGQLVHLATRWAERLGAHGGAEEQAVVLVSERRSDIVIGMLACLLAERAFVVLDPALPVVRLRDLLRQLGGAPMLASSACLAALESLADVGGPRFSITRENQCERLVESAGVQPDCHHQPPPPLDCAGLAYVIFTSGSTGQPKPVGIERKALEQFSLLVADSYRLQRSDAVLQFASLTFDACIEEIFPTLAAGATICCRSEESIASATNFLRFLEQNLITVASLPTAFWADFMQECWRSGLGLPSGLRLIIVGGEELTAQHLRVWEALRPPWITLINTYGPTEATVEVAWLNLEHSWLYRHHVPLGRPLDNAELRVLDPGGEPCPIGIPGELHIAGASLARGYLNDPERTSAQFIVDPLRADGSARLYRSGDLASWNSDGTLAFHGRIDQQIKLRGYRIEPQAVAAVLQTHPAVAQAVVVLTAEDHRQPPLLVGYWVPEQQRPPRQVVIRGVMADQLRCFLSERLPDYMVPAAFLQLEALPLTPNGKLDRKALPAPSFSENLEQRVAPSTDLERQLHAIWAEVLGHSDFGITDNFFAIGGHSLAAARLVSRIEQAIGSAPTLAALFQNPSIAGLTPLLDASSAAAEAQPISAAESLPGDWPQHCLAFPASYAQSRLWFLHQLESDLTAYHLPLLWRLSGELDPKALCLALADLIERHPTLRTSFRLQGSEVVQIIHPPVACPLAAELLANRDPDAVIQEWLRQEASTPFDLASGLLLRARLLQVADDAHVFLLNHHHIASDGWSCSVLTRDLTELYNGHHGGRSAQLPPLRFHYQDYALWQRQRLSGAHFKKLNDYWIAALTGLEPLEIPTDHLRPVTPSFQGSSLSFEIESALLEPFQELCRSEGATLQMGLLALVALLLHRYSRQEDFAIGIPIWGRSHPEFEPLIGLFINTLPVRTRFSPELTFRQLLVQVKTTSIAAYEHQELPFERMVEALNLERDASRNPLVQVMLQLIELPESSPHNLDGLVVDALPSKSESSKLDLSFYLRRTIDQGLRVSINYAIDLFSADRIERLSAHLLTLLSSVLQAPDATVHALRLLPEAERLLMASWQQGPRIQSPDLCVHQLFEQQVERSPDAIALIFEDQRLTYRELNARANQLAHHLIDLGVGPEVIVAISLQRSVELIVALFAILKAGGAYLSLDPAWPKVRASHVLKSAQCHYIITQEDHGALSDVVESAALIYPYRVQGLGLSVANPVAHSCQLDHLAYVNFTSGSTGAPKGIAMAHRAVALKCLSVCCEWELTAKDRVLALSSFGFDISLRETIFPLAMGCTSVLVAEEERKSPQELARLIASHAVTRIQATPSYWEQLVRHGIHTLNPMMVIAIGEALNPSTASSLCEAPQSRLLHLYGTTEAPGSCGMLYRQPSSIHTVSIGTPLQNTSIFILEPSGHPCPIGIAGELHIGGEGLARDYLNNPELTAQTFIPDPFSGDPSARLYKSGDLASWNSDGTLAFHGRIDQQIKLRGFRIEPGEVEAHLLAHPAVAQVAVVLRNDDPANPRLIAYWVCSLPDPAAAASAEQLRAFLAERLPESMVPAAFLQLEALPLTTNGKLDRQALPAPSFVADGQQRVAPSTDLERQLHAIWVEVLGHADFGVTDNFFWIGGHSILAMRLKQLVDERLGFDIPIYTYFSEPTIAVFSNSLLCRGSVGDDSVALPLLSAPNDFAAFAPPLIQEFIGQQQVFLRHWPGELLPGHRFVRMLGDGGTNMNLFWCFQGANEFQALADHLFPGVNVFGMRSAHGIEGAREIYRNPSLLAFVATLYAREMLALQPDGQPFVLGGNCQAGLLAVSIAHHLIGWGREVKMLILMEPRLERIRSGVLSWQGATGLIWGAESKFNPFLASNKMGRSRGRIRHHIFRGYYRKKVTKSLVRAFGGGFALSFIPGGHGDFFGSENIEGLASVIQDHVVTTCAEGSSR